MTQITRLPNPPSSILIARGLDDGNRQPQQTERHRHAEASLGNIIRILKRPLSPPPSNLPLRIRLHRPATTYDLLYEIAAEAEHARRLQENRDLVQRTDMKQ
ncbi:uncharacterized protein PG986_000081 [Apiospora aurea]|uniref:Uncharacterized protein n=1 Tax=Apiospora aurea TaxID=335848 RepID=A0ABR1QT79_9PEZI